jgi:hypothetical protein
VLATVLVPLIVAVAVLLIALVLFGGVAQPTAQEHLMRERRRDAELTAYVMQRMVAIRNQTIERMDRAEGGQDRD